MFDRISINPKFVMDRHISRAREYLFIKLSVYWQTEDFFESLLKAYPTIEREDIRACLEYAVILSIMKNLKRDHSLHSGRHV